MNHFNKSSQFGGKNNWSNSVAQQPPGEVLVGSKSARGVAEDSGTRDIIGLENMLSVNHVYANITGSHGTTFAQTAIMSLDGLIRPISLGGDGGLPQFGVGASSSSSNFIVPPVYQTGALLESNNVPIYQATLNPFTNPEGYSWSDLSEYNPSGGNFVGHDIDIIGRGVGYGSGPGTSGLPMPSTVPGDGVASGQADYANDYRPFALRGPLVVQGWGFTTDGLPIPNEIDTVEAASNGSFNNTVDRTSKFLDGWLQKSSTWPVGPVDMRWDNTRKVWSTNFDYQLKEYMLTGDLLVGEIGWAQTSTTTVYPSGTGYSGVEASVGFYFQSPVNDYLPSGTNIVARYNGTSIYDIIDTDYKPPSIATAILSGTLFYDSSTTASIVESDHPIPGAADGVSVHDYLLNPGESLIINTKVILAAFYNTTTKMIDHWKVINASCVVE